MSHEATNWALKQRGIKPAAKIVLFHLADRHNPDYGCFPSHNTLAKDCEMSKRSVQNHLEALEQAGLIRKENRMEEGVYTSNRYFLGFENDFRPAGIAKSANGKICQRGSAKFARGVVQNLPPNPVSNNPVSNNLVNGDLLDEFERFWKYYPRKVGKGAAKKAWIKARAKTYLEEIAIPLKHFVQAINGTEMSKIPHAATWLNQERWLDDQSHANNGNLTAEADIASLGAEPAEDNMAALFKPESDTLPEV